MTLNSFDGQNVFIRCGHQYRCCPSLPVDEVVNRGLLTEKTRAVVYSGESEAMTYSNLVKIVNNDNWYNNNITMDRWYNHSKLIRL